MKKFVNILGAIVLFAIIGFSFTTCDISGSSGGGSGGGGTGGNPKGLFILDISKQTEWDYMIGDKKGERVFLRANESGSLPKEMYLTPDKNSDIGYTILFKDNGLPDKVVHKDYILVFGKFNGYKYDVAVITPDGKTKGHFGVESDIDFDAFTKKAASAQGRSVGSDIKDVLMPDNFLEAAGLAIDLASCATAFLVPGTAFECIKFLAVQVLKVVSVVALDDLPEETATMLLEAFECVDGLGIKNLLNAITAADDCIGLLAHMAQLLFDLDKVYIEGTFNEEVVDTVFLLSLGIDFKKYDVCVITHWTGGGGLLFAIRTPEGNVYEEGGPDNSKYYWIGLEPGAAPVGTYTVGVRPVMAWGSTLKVTVHIYSFGTIKAFYRDDLTQAPMDPGTVWRIVTRFDNKGNFSTDGTEPTAPTPVAPTGVTLDQPTLTLSAGSLATLTAAIEPENASNKSVTWTTSDATKVRVVKGVVVGVAEGSATITATTADGRRTATCVVTVSGSAGSGGGIGSGGWTEVGNSTFGTTTINAIAWGNGKFVAGGNNGKMAYSSDGLTWTAVSNSPFGTNAINAIAWGNSTFVAVGDYGTLAYSFDGGVTWTAKDIGPFGTNNIKALTYGRTFNGSSRFLTVGIRQEYSDTLSLSSADGISWTGSSINTIFDDSSFRSYGVEAIVSNNNTFLVWGSGNAKNILAYSWEGIVNEWRGIDYFSSMFGTGTSISTIAGGDGTFVVGNNNGKMWTSTDGTSWTAVSNSTFGTNAIKAICWGISTFVAVGDNNTLAYSSDGGVTWTAKQSGSFGTNNIKAIAHGSGKFVAVGYNGKIAYLSGN